MKNSTNSKLKNPFVGLRPFEENEHYLFFGRKKSIEDLSVKLMESNFLSVIGTSGSGKSSLVKSGLLPNIFSGFFAVGSNWRVALLRPGENPIGYLADALSEKGSLFSKIAPEDSQLHKVILETSLRRSENGLIQVYKEAMGITIMDEEDKKKKPDHLLIVVDQFEELFRFRKYEKENNPDKSDAQHFIRLLLTAAQQTEYPIYVMTTMRSDFLGDCSEFIGLPEAINKGQYLVPRMSRDEIRDCVTIPVAISGATISPRLVNRILNDIGDNPDQLPILQHAMMRTWDAWFAKGNWDSPIDFDEYDAIGGMTDALSKHANEAYDELTDTQQKTVALIFKALTEKTENKSSIRRPMKLKELAEYTNTAKEELIQIIDIFRQQGRTFLMPPPHFPLNDETIIDIAHESLIRQWDKLIKWVEEETESSKIYLRLCEAASLYENDKKDLITGTELQIALKWYKEIVPNKTWSNRYNNLFDDAISYLNRSEINADEIRKQNELNRLKAIETEQQLLNSKRMKRIGFGFAVIGSLAIIASLFAIYSLNKANVARSGAEVAARKADSLSRIAIAEKRIAINSATIIKRQNEALITSLNDLTEKSGSLSAEGQKEAKVIESVLRKGLGIGKLVAKPIGSVDYLKIDIFYLQETQSESQPLAQQVAAVIKAQYPKFNVRVRLLTKEANNKPGYHIDANQIRCEKNEFDIGNSINTLIKDKRVLPREQPYIHFATNVTTNYISVFVRNQ